MRMMLPTGGMLESAVVLAAAFAVGFALFYRFKDALARIAWGTTVGSAAALVRLWRAAALQWAKFKTAVKNRAGP